MIRDSMTVKAAEAPDVWKPLKLSFVMVEQLDDQWSWELILDNGEHFQRVLRRCRRTTFFIYQLVRIHEDLSFPFGSDFNRGLGFQFQSYMRGCIELV